MIDPEDRHELGYYYLYYLCAFLIVPNFMVLGFDLCNILRLILKKRKIHKIHKEKLKLAKEEKQKASELGTKQKTLIVNEVN